MDDDTEGGFLLEFRPEITGKYPFPDDKLNREQCMKSTELFARDRLFHHYDVQEMTDDEKLLAKNKDIHIVDGFRFNPILSYFVKEYPLPIGGRAIEQCYVKHFWDSDPIEIIPSAIVENRNAFAGLAKRFSNGNTIGWFIGLVEMYDLFNMTDSEEAELNEDEIFWAYYSKTFRFVEGMILLEGKLSESDKVKRQLENFEKFYNKHILGKIVTGRPRIDPTNMMNAAREILKVNPEISQEKLTEKLGIADISTFKKYRKAADYATYEDFKESVKNS